MAGLGARVAEIYGWWALFLLMGCLGPHLLVVARYAFAGWRRPLRWFRASSEQEVRAVLLQHQETIVAVSRERQLDPRLLASVVLVTQRDIDRPFLSGVEELVTDAWLVDSTSGLLLAEALDPSLGLAQVKAHTVLTAYAIHAVANLAYSAFLLELVASQWEAANPNWAIRSRPDIMATIFQLGFRNSIPRAEPQPNDLGERVQRAFDDPWMQAQFPREGRAP